MKTHTAHLNLTALALTAVLWGACPAWAQVAGGTTIANVSVTRSTELAMGWSVKKTLLGKTIYNDVGEKVGKVDDLIISPDKNVSFVIVGAGGFIGMGRHDVAIPVSEIKNEAGKLVMAGATKDMIKAMPKFMYVGDTAERDQFVASAEADIAKGRAMVIDLEKKANEATAEAKARIASQITALQSDIKLAEGKLATMKQANVVRWKEFKASVSAATARVRKSIDAAIG